METIKNEILPSDEAHADEKFAIAHLLINDVIMVFQQYEKEKPYDERGSGLSVLCSDTFAYACADAEDLPYNSILELYRRWREDPRWGVTQWISERRSMVPIPPLVDLMKKEGAWDETMQQIERRKSEDLHQ